MCFCSTFVGEREGEREGKRSREREEERESVARAERAVWRGVLLVRERGRGREGQHFVGAEEREGLVGEEARKSENKITERIQNDASGLGVSFSSSSLLRRTLESSPALGSNQSRPVRRERSRDMCK